MHRGSRELVGSGPGPTDFGPFSAARLSRLREGGEAGCWPETPVGTWPRSHPGLAGKECGARWALWRAGRAASAKYSQRWTCQPFVLSGLVAKNRDLRLEKLPGNAQKHRRFPDVSARQVLLCTEQASSFQGPELRRSFSTVCHPCFWAACFFREGLDFTQP